MTKYMKNGNLKKINKSNTSLSRLTKQMEEGTNHLCE